MDEEEIGIEFWALGKQSRSTNVEGYRADFEVVQKQQSFEEVEGDLEMFLNGTWYVLRAKQESMNYLRRIYLTCFFTLFLASKMLKRTGVSYTYKNVQRTKVSGW